MKSKKRFIFWMIILILYILTIGSFVILRNNNFKSKTTEINMKDTTIFIYMCGSNLETKQGLAGKNIDEILSADLPDSMNIVIQTGGTKKWRSHKIKNGNVQRYEVKNQQLELKETVEADNMGESDTLADFLIWGDKAYQSEHKMLIFWDHGGGAVKGVCFDENHIFDALTLSEIKDAFQKAKPAKKFDIIGFDACLMASIEVAETVGQYADYMIASEEIEPAGGWDYKSLINAFKNEKDAVSIGKIICDSFVLKHSGESKSLFATLSLFDLSKMKTLGNEFSKAVNAIAATMGKQNFASQIFDATENCEKFGGDNAYQGCANMLDLDDFAGKAFSSSVKAADLHSAVDEFVVYCAKANQRKNKGVSFYYPFIYNEDEIQSYIKLNIYDNYNKSLEKFFLNIPKKTIEFKDKGSIAKNGAFKISLTKGSDKYLNSIDFLLMTTDKKGVRQVICSDNDITKDWEHLKFKSNFRGICLALDGHRLFSNAVCNNEDYVTFNAPLLVNGKKTNLRFVFIWDDSYKNNGYYKIGGLWNGYDENGLLDNNITPLKKGDKVQLITSTKLENGRTKEVLGDEFVIGDNGGEISEIPLDEKIYQYVYVVTDIFGNTFTSDMATFKITKTYEELLENPLPDEVFAAKVTKIEPYESKEQD